MTIFEKHQKRIARQTLAMSPKQAMIAGGMSFEEAYRIIYREPLRPRLERLISEYDGTPICWELGATDGWQPQELLDELNN